MAAVGVSLAQPFTLLTAVGASDDLTFDDTGVRGPMPDINGFISAQRRQHSYFDGDVVFVIPATSPTYPAGTSLDENGVPFDPMIEPTSGSDDETTVTIKAAVVDEAALTDSSATGTPLGVVESETVYIIIPDPTDKSSVEDATAVEVYEMRWKITEWKPDGIGSTIDRWLVRCEEARATT